MIVHYNGPSGSWDTKWPSGQEAGRRVFVDQHGRTIEYKLVGVQDGHAHYVEVSP